MRHSSRSMTAARRRSFLPTLCGLERREALTTAVLNLAADPQVLSPPNNRYVHVVITGNVVDTNKKVTPDAQYTVVDEYRRIDPRGQVKLTKVLPQVYTFRFVLTLQAQRANSDASGRQYNLIVGASDLDNSEGEAITILVPHNALKTGQTIAPYPIRHPATNRKLPPVSIPTKSSGPASGIPIFGNLFGGSGKKK